MRLRFSEFQLQLTAWALHQRVTVSPPLQHAGFDPPGTVGHFMGGDVGQHLILPAAMRLLQPTGRVVTLIKPHYEAEGKLLRKGVLPDEQVEGVVRAVLERLGHAGIRIVDAMDSPIRGQGGNREVFALVRG